MKRWMLALFAALSSIAGAEEMALNEQAASRECMGYAEAQEIYRRTDWDGNGVLEYSQSMHGGLKARVPALDLEKLPAPNGTEQAEIQKLITALAAEEFEAREKAHQKLLALGLKAYKQINAAIKLADDPEKRDRCSKLVIQIREALAPEQPAAQRWGLYTSGRAEAAVGDISLIDGALANAECPIGVDRKTCTPKAGYLFRILTAQGDKATGGKRSYLTDKRLTLGYALVAFPAEYGKTGQRVFMINNNGTIFCRDFGNAEATEKMMENCAEFNPDKEWKATD